MPVEYINATGPDGTDVQLMKITDEADEAYRMPVTVPDATQYILSVWARADVESAFALDLFGKIQSFTLSSAWKRYSLRVSRDEKDGDAARILVMTADALYIHNAQLETGGYATDWRPAPEDADASFAEITASLSDSVEAIQNQMDGNITTWFYAEAPGNQNEPAVNWTSASEKNMHLGDLYYNTDTGYCYRWTMVGGSSYGWQRITDTDVTRALENAQHAQDTADSKRRVFVGTPRPPYDVGDMWLQGENGDILRCATAKESGSFYAAADWVKASMYTDDTAAKAYADALNAQQDARAVHVGGSAPESPNAGKLWLDQSVTPAVLRRYTGAENDDAWEIVNDTAEIKEAHEQIRKQTNALEEAQKTLGMALDVENDGVHIHRPITSSSAPSCETLITDHDFRVTVNGKNAASFAASNISMNGKSVIRITSSGFIFGG